MHPKGANSMATSGLGCRKAMGGIGWAISLLLCMNWLRKQHSGLVGPPFLTVTFLLVCNWPSRDYENSLMSGCGLSHESPENGCKGSWVKFSKPKGTGIMVRLMDP